MKPLIYFVKMNHPFRLNVNLVLFYSIQNTNNLNIAFSCTHLKKKIHGQNNNNLNWIFLFFWLFFSVEFKGHRR